MKSRVEESTLGRPYGDSHPEEDSVSLEKILQEDRLAILNEAVESLCRAHLKHYETAGPDLIRERLDNLLRIVLEALLKRSLTPIVTHAAAVAVERFEAGVDLHEVQTAFNVLEEILWLRILTSLPASEQAQALGLIGTVLGNGKDALARKYVSMATQTRTPSLDLKALFSGSDSF
jgi:hypothetical protein